MKGMVPRPEGRRMAPLWVQATVVVGCVAVLGGIAIASWDAWNGFGKDEARCIQMLDRLLGDESALSGETRKAVQAEFDRCKDLGTITAEDVEDYVDKRGASEDA